MDHLLRGLAMASPFFSSLLVAAVVLHSGVASAFAEGMEIAAPARSESAVPPAAVTAEDDRSEQPPPRHALLRDPVDAWSGSGSGSGGWHWRRGGIPEYVGVAVGAAATVYLEVEHGHPKAKWTAHNGFDEGIRDALRLESRDARDATHTAGDVIMGVMISAPVLDSLATLGIRDSRWDALWQTELINLESFTFTSLVSSLIQNIIAPRERPFVRNCVGNRCEDSQQNRSMPSGHVAYAFTGAGLICNHHEHQSLYGNSTADRAACATGIVLATAEGFLRIMADRHYATDVLAGAAIGLFSGFLMPRWLHYDWAEPAAGEKKAGQDDAAVTQLTVAPVIYEGGGGVAVALRF